MNVLTSVWPSPCLTSVLPGWRVFSNISSLLFIILSLQTKVLLNPHRDNRGVSENKSGQTAVKQMSERRRIRLIVLSTVRPLLGSCAHLTPTYVCTWFEFVATYTPGLVLNNGKMHPHKPSHRLPHLQSAHTGKKKQTTALRQLAEGQPAKGVGERHIYRQRVKGRKVLT